MDKPPISYTTAGAPLVNCEDETGCAVQQCEVCLKEIPSDATNVSDAQDYVHYFASFEKRVGNGLPGAASQGRAQPGGANP